MAQNQQKWTRGEKSYSPLKWRGLFLKKNSQSNSSYPIFEPLKKSLNITLLLLELKDDCVEVKMAILEQFKLLNLKNKNEKVMHRWSRRRQKEEKWKKPCFVLFKNVFSLLLFFGCSLGFAFQRWFIELEKALLLEHFKSLKMEKI